MHLRLRDLDRRILRAGRDMFVGAALGALAEQADPTGWLLLFRDTGGFVVLSAEQLARRLRDDELLFDRRLRDLELPISPALELDSTLEQAQQLSQRTGYTVVLREGEPCGVLRQPHLALGEPNLQRLLGLAARWQPPKASGVLSDGEPTPRDLSTPAPAPQLEGLPQRTDRYVNSDFASEQSPGQPLDRQQPLQQGRAYYFRLHVGEAEASSIEATPTLLPELVLRDTVDLRVVIFSEDFELAENTGVLRVPTDGPASVAEPASTAGLTADDPLLAERLLFLVRVPGGKRGVCSLRVNIYRNGMLVQSRLVSARVGAGRPLAESGAQLLSTLDYNLSPALTPGHLRDVAPHTLSMMLNSNGDGTHAFRVVGQEGQELITNSVILSSSELDNLISDARGVLRRAAWGKAEPWAEGMAYRYEPGTNAETIKKNFTADLINLAVRGALTYNTLKNALGQDTARPAQLREMLRQPRMIQLASKISANDVVPIALFYDWPIDTRAKTLTICPKFEESLSSGRPLISEPCFMGECPSREDLSVMCPSGFWGFRHDIGMPWPAPYGPEVATTIRYSGTPLLDAALNQEFPGLPSHLKRLGGLGYQMQSQTARELIFSMFKQTQPQVVYFYCHGVLNGSTPTLKVGPPQDYIDTSNFDNFGIAWPEARPLVFINGCHTTALSPSQAISFVRTFVEDVAAAGVIGTEITIFEPLAQTFAETFLPLFAKGTAFGRAIREARLALLAQRNPLGLVYQPYAYAGLQLVAS